MSSPPGRSHSMSDESACRFAHRAMGCEFEIVIADEIPEYAQQAAWAAFDELDAINGLLSRFEPTSDVAQINSAKAGQEIRVSAATWRCLQVARQVHAETLGAFDPTIGALLAAWANVSPGEVEPDANALADAWASTGMTLLEFLADARAIRVPVDALRLDLGGIGKGFALDAMADVLGEWGITAAMLHSGQSTVLALGSVSANEAWKVALRDPAGGDASPGTVRLSGRALAGSGAALHGRHIIDPRMGKPADQRPAAWASALTAAEADAMSTALMVMSRTEAEEFCRQHPNVWAILADESGALTPIGPWDADFARTT